MGNVNTIVAALDLEPGSDAVLARAIQLAAGHAARLVVLHVVEAEPLSQAAALSDRSEGELRDQLKHQTLATIAPLLIESGRIRRTEVQVEFGSPHEVITHIAHERSVDLIVIGPGKGHSFKEKILGSTADRVIRSANAPVLVVRKNSVEPYREAVVAVDFSLQSELAAKEARMLVPEASLQLVHVSEIPITFQQALLRAGTSQLEIDRYRSARADSARKELAAFTGKLAGEGKVVSRVVDGEPGPAFVHLSKDRRVDLLVMGPHGRGIVRQALLGSVTQRVLRESECDVLIGSDRK